MMYIGIDMLRTSQVRKQEKKIHTDTLEELSSSFDDKIKPMVVDDPGHRAPADGNGRRAVSGMA